MEFELPKINVSFEFDEEKDEIVFVINGVEKRVKTKDMITEMEKLQEQNTALEQQPYEDCISRKEVLALKTLVDTMTGWSGYMIDALDVEQLPSIQPKPNTGHWVIIEAKTDWYDAAYKCSCCGREIITPYELIDNLYNDYPDCHCGAKMESEDKECPLKESQE